MGRPEAPRSTACSTSPGCTGRWWTTVVLRAAEVSVPTTTASWRELLERTLPAAIAAERGGGGSAGDPGPPPISRRLLRYVDRLRFAIERSAATKR